MNEEWRNGVLGDVADITMGQSPAGETCNQVGNGLPLLNGPTEFTAKYPIPVQFTVDSKRICEPGDILFCVRGSTTGKMNFADQRYAIGRGIASIRHKNGTDLQPYLKGLIDSILPQLLSKTTGSVFPNITADDLRTHEIVLPPPPEQTAIAKILSSLDDKIDLLHRQNKTLEQMAETLFRQWFVEEAEESWEERALVDYVLFDPKETIGRNRPYQFFDMKCLSNHDMHISDGIYRVATSGSSFRNFDTLLAKITPCLENGKTGFVMHLGTDEIARGSTEFIVMRSKGEISPYWIYCLARSDEFREKAIQSMTGTSGRQRVQIDVLKNIRVKIDSARMQEFDTYVMPWFEKIKSNHGQVRSLVSTRDLLLPKLMTGEIQLQNSTR